MKTQIKQPQPVSHTIQSKTKAANQASLSKILQKYQPVAQRESIEDEDELLQGKFETAQREELDDDEELLQGKFESTAQCEESPSIFNSPLSTKNNTGLPDDVKAGVEAMSGYSMDDVRVHYNSPKPAQLQALAYAQGTDIHVAPGQEKHLPHEAWHVVQQKQGRVQPTMQLQGVNVNDNEGLEREADIYGMKILNTHSTSVEHNKNLQRASKYSSSIQKIYSVFQCCTQDDIDKVKQICGNHHIALNDEEAKNLIKQIDKQSITPRIKNHHAILRRWGNTFRVVSQRFSGTGLMGRISDTDGATASIEDGVFFDLPEHFTSSMHVDQSSLSSVTTRAPLASVMGGSAYDASSIINAEWLHRVGHQLGGLDIERNLMAGFHATNTAMIPIENLVRDIASQGIDVKYSVQLLPRVGPVLWTSDAVIKLELMINMRTFTKTWYIEVDGSKSLDKKSYDTIVNEVTNFKRCLGI